MMHRLCLVVLLTAELPGGPQGARPTAEATLAELQHSLAKAWVAGDRPAIERVIATDWTTTGPDGSVRTRAQVLAEVFERRVHRIHTVEIDDLHVRVFGDAAVVNGRTHGIGEFAGAAYDVRIRFTDVFVRRDGRWQAVASHASLLPAGP